MTPTTVRQTAPALIARAGAVAVAVLLALLVVAPVASAHEAGAGVRYRTTGMSPEVDGLTVQVVRGLAGQLVLGNDTGEVVEVLDDDGEAFLRIGPDGVEADVASPTWAASDRPFGLRSADPQADRTAPARWIRLSESSSWGWYDHRLHRQEVTPPAGATEPVVLERWDIPLRVGGRAVTVSGETIAGPPLGFVTPRLVSDRSPAEGVSVTLLPGQTPGLLLAVDEGHRALVRGEVGEPFLRFADGSVQVNAASPTWHRTGGGQVEAVAVDADADPVWQRVADGQRFGWVEPRAIAPEVDGNPEDGAVLATWAVPVEVDGQATTMLGELRWVRNPAVATDDGLPWLNVALAAAGLLAIGALVVVRRRAARSRPTAPAGA